jgi:glycosyltransferase involved in cell wall biosynthesis
MVCPNYYPVTCGVGDYSMNLGHELIRRGADVALFTHEPAVRNPECPAVDVFTGSGRTPLQVVMALQDALRAYDPDELIVQYTPQMLCGSRFGTLAIPILLDRMRGRARCTVIAHELFMSWSWRPDLALGGALQRLQFSAVMASADRLFVTTVNRRLRVQHMLRQSGRDRDVQLLFVGANAPPLPPSPRPSGRLGTFSMMGRNRRFDLMVDAFELVAAKHPTAELVFIGDLGTDASPLYRALRAHAARSPVNDRIRFTGPLPLARVAEAVAGLSVYLFPDDTGASTRSSTLPVALGSGIPVVATRGLETADDFFRDDENIVYADRMASAALAEATLRVLDDRALASRVGEGGRRLFEQHLSWGAIASKLLAS